MTIACDFCTDLANGLPLQPSRPMWVSSRLALMPTIGPLTTGHMLLVPRQHLTSFGALDAADWADALKAIAGVEGLLERRFGVTLAFEHGTSGSPTAGGCGIDHAHMHFLPVRRSVRGLPPLPDAKWHQLDDNWLVQLQSLSSQRVSYVYIRTAEGSHFATPVRSLPSQFVRRWMAEQVGLKRWDWRQSDPERDFAAAAGWMALETPPRGFFSVEQRARAAS